MPTSSTQLKNVIRRAVPRPIRNWLRSPSRSAEWLWDAATFYFGGTKRLDLLPDWTLVCHPHFFKVVHRAQILDPEQSEEFRTFLSHCSDGMMLFDIGAHFGVFSLAAAHFGGAAIAVDPSSTALNMIRAEVKLNECAGRIELVRAAVSERTGEMDLLSSGTFSDGYFKVERGRLPSDLTKIKSTTVNDMVVQFGVPTHVKIDVEGHEAAVLRGARSTLERYSPLLFLELHNQMVESDGGNPKDALDILEDLGYRTLTLGTKRIERAAILQRPIIRIVAQRI
jgi:FkbM family methyltransferase